MSESGRCVRVMVGRWASVIMAYVQFVRFGHMRLRGIGQPRISNQNADEDGEYSSEQIGADPC